MSPLKNNLAFSNSEFCTNLLNKNLNKLNSKINVHEFHLDISKVKDIIGEFACKLQEWQGKIIINNSVKVDVDDILFFSFKDNKTEKGNPGRFLL